MNDPKEKTNTKTLEIKNVPAQLDAGTDSSAPKKSIGDLTDPTLAANRTAIAHEEHTRKVLLSQVMAKENANKEDDSNGGIEFSAATAVLKMTPEMLKELKQDKEKQESTVKLNLPGLSDEEVKKIKIEVKTHYIKKARILEQEITTILAALKTSNPVIQKQFDRIRDLLGRHSGRIKDGPKK